jgi:hypothetical protein
MKRRTRIAIAGLVIAIAGVVVSIVAISKSRSADFVINVTPSEGLLETGRQFSTKVIIESQKYDGQIRLSAENFDKNLDVSFKPESGIASPRFESIVTIEAESDLEEGDYSVDILAMGSKNKLVHSTTLFLDVVDPPFDPQYMTSLFYPDGFMGDTAGITLEVACSENPYSGSECLKIVYAGRGNPPWAGIFWLYPNHNWGILPNGRNLEGAQELSFMARGAVGGERAEFKLGGVNGTYQDSFYPERGIFVDLTTEWQEYTIDLSDRDLSIVFGGFCWGSTDRNPNGCVVYLDEIVFR